MNELQQKFIDYLLKEKNYSLCTVTAYKKDIENFLVFCNQNFSNISVEKISYDMVRLWLANLSDKNYTNKTINRKVSSLKSFFRFLYQAKQIPEYIFTVHKSLKNEKRVQLPFSEQEMFVFKNDDFSDDFDGIRNRLILELFYFLGLRRAELIALKVVHLDLSSKTLLVHGKRNKQRLMPLAEPLVALLKKYIILRSEKDFLSSEELLLKNGKKLNESFVYRLINAYFRGITSKQKTSPHVLRHTFATHLLSNGADLNAIKELMGHSSLSSTQIYTGANLEKLKKVYIKAHPRDKED